MSSSEARVLVAVPNLGWIRSDLVDRAVFWMKEDGVTWYAPQNLRPQSYARNHCVEYLLEKTGCTHIFFVDHDTLPPFDAVRKLLEVGAPVVSGIAHNLKRDVDGVLKPVPCVARMEVGGYRPLTDGDGVMRIDASGGACWMIETKVFALLDRPWFTDEVGPDGVRGDFRFCQRLEDAGIPQYAHFGVQCLHRKEVDL